MPLRSRSPLAPVTTTLLAAALLAAGAAPMHAQDPAPRGGSHAVEGAEIHYEEHGSGPPLVLLHGFMGCADTWEPHVARLAEHYRVIVPELRGHGRSTNPAGTFTHRQSARDVLALLDRLGVGRFSALGISSGGMTLLHAATSQPERIERMVLIGATSYFPEQAREIMRGSTSLEAMPPEVLDQFRGCASRGDDQVRELLGIFHGFRDSVDDMNFTAPYLARVRAPTLVVHGDRDEFFPVEIPVGMYDAIPESYLWIVPNGDHVPIYGRRAEPFVSEVLAFLRGEWDRR